MTKEGDKVRASTGPLYNEGNDIKQVTGEVGQVRTR